MRMTQIRIQVTPELHDWLRARAGASLSSVSQVVRAAIAKAMREEAGDASGK